MSDTLVRTNEGEQDGLDFFRIGRTTKSVEPSAIVAKTPSVILTRPKFPHNVGQALRLCSCYGVEQLWITGNRVALEAADGERLPREERMKGYRDVDLFQYDRPYDLFPADTNFVAVEMRPNAEGLSTFEHPENAVYVFGPEDGTLGRSTLGLCQRFIIIPTRHCLNLATAVGTVLYDRQAKEIRREAGY